MSAVRDLGASAANRRPKFAIQVEGEGVALGLWSDVLYGAHGAARAPMSALLTRGIEEQS